MDTLPDPTMRLLAATNEIASDRIWGMPSYACWIIIGVLLVLSGLFSASENAFSNCNKYHFRAEAEKGKQTAKVITYLVDQFDKTLITVLISSNTVQTLMSFLSAMLWYQICERNGWGSVAEALLSTVMMGILFYIIADTIPKVISKAIPNQMAIVMAYPIIFIQLLLYPLILLFKALLNFIHKLFNKNDTEIVSNEQVLQQVDEAVSDDAIVEDENEDPEKLFESDEKQIIKNVMSFDQRKVRDVFTPLEKVYAIPLEGLTTDVVNDAIVNTDFSRFPVYDETKDNIIGILVTKVYFEEYVQDPHLSIPSVLEDTIIITPDDSIDDAFDALNNAKVHLGIVKDGDTVLGVVSMEDILEELVSDISEDATMEPEVIQHD